MTAPIVRHVTRVWAMTVPVASGDVWRKDFAATPGQLWERVAEGRVQPRWSIRVGTSLYFYPNKRAAFHAFGHLPAGATLIPPDESP